MQTYIVLGNFTDQGIRAVKDTTKRASAVKEAALLFTIGSLGNVRTQSLRAFESDGVERILQKI